MLKSKRVDRLAKVMPGKQKQIKFVVGEGLPKKLEEDKFYIHVVGFGGEQVSTSTNNNNVAEIKRVPLTSKDIEQQLRDAGFDPELLRLDEGSDGNFCVFNRELRLAQARGEFFNYPGGKRYAKFVFEMPKKPDDSVFYIVVEAEESRKNE